MTSAIALRPAGVRWSDPNEGESNPVRYTLVVSLPAPHHNTREDHTEWRFPEHANQTAVLITKCEKDQEIDPNIPVVIGFWTWRNAERGEPCMYRAGHCVTTLSALCAEQKTARTLELKNVKGQPQAILKLSAVNHTLRFAAVPNPKWSLDRVSSPKPMTIGDMLGGMDVAANGRVPRAFLRDQVGHIFGDMPVWMTCMLYGNGASERVTESYLRNALYHSVRMLGFRGESDWAKSIGEEDPLAYETLAKVCAFNVHPRRYLFDKTRVKGKGLVGSDQFSVIEAAPDAAGAAGDCEDVAHSINDVLQAIHELCHEDYPKSDPLHHLIRMAYGYCCFTADVSINPQGKEMPADERKDDPLDLSLHHLALFIPWSTVRQMFGAKSPLDEKALGEDIARTKGWPMLSVEGTEACRANPTADTRPLDSFAESCRVIRRGSIRASATLRRGSNDATYRIFENAKFYRQLVALYSADLYRLYGIAMMIPCENRRHGARWCRWVTTRSQDVEARGLSMFVSKIATAQEMDLVDRFTQWLPKLTPLQMPSGFQRETWKVDGTRTAMFVVWREVDLPVEERDAVKHAFKNQCQRRYGGQHRVTVTEGFTVIIMRFF
jgi:hypothetical protein